ncbi:hypothetical protein AU467_23695 [Mesorhizobium loti]|uniref:Uncharacterized protein n=1 Tax=Rhizobium loti TaxID=381 RepID=A0A117N3H9_RHILI|nr:hypothetical protein AU467_23695 [Mesorhizobium loti]
MSWARFWDACRDSWCVYTGPDEAITSLTRDGMEELEQMLAHARRTADEWNDFLEAFVSDPHTIARIKAKSPR